MEVIDAELWWIGLPLGVVNEKREASEKHGGNMVPVVSNLEGGIR